MASKRFSQLQDGAFPRDTDIIGIERADGVSYQLSFAQLSAFVAQRAMMMLPNISDAEEPIVIPGVAGAAGTPGANGAQGRDGAVIFFDPVEPEDVFPIQGPAGASGGGGGGGLTHPQVMARLSLRV